jgi:hypothetical protein
MAVNEHLFPDLARTGYQITSPPDPSCNCIAHAAGVPRERTLTAFIEAFATLDYAPCTDGALESGWEKVAIYAKDEGPTHAARQLENGRWSSKLGPDDDIEHRPKGLVSAVYGPAVCPGSPSRCPPVPLGFHGPDADDSLPGIADRGGLVLAKELRMAPCPCVPPCPVNRVGPEYTA